MTVPADDHSGTDLERRLRAVEDRLALLDLEGEYGPAYDSGDGARWSGLFTPDGVYQGRQLDGMAAQNLVRGRDDLARFCDEQPSSGTHFMHMPTIRLDGDEATSRVHFEYRASGTDEWRRTHSRVVTGYYDVAYVRTDEGWRIRRRVTTYLELTTKTTYPYEPEPADLDAPLPADRSYQDER